VLGFEKLAETSSIAVSPLGGHRPSEAKVRIEAIRSALSQRIWGAVILDRDFRCDEELENLKESLSDSFDIAHIHPVKEIKNYVLIPAAIERVIIAEIFRQTRHGGDAPAWDDNTEKLLDEIVDGLKTHSLTQFQSSYEDWHRKARPGEHRSVFLSEAAIRFERIWGYCKFRIAMVPGKLALSSLNRHVRRKYGVNISASYIIGHTARNEVATDLINLLRELEHAIEV